MVLEPISSDSIDAGEFIVYRTDDGSTEVHLRTVGGTVWMTQRQIAELYDITVSTVSRHLTKIFEEGDLARAQTVAQREIVGLEQGKEVHRRVEHYNLDTILAVGYRVRGPRGTQFRQWATTVLREYLVKGFVMNDARLKDPQGLDYFDELLQRIREIRASEKRFYIKVRDVFKEASVDYDPSSEVAKNFFATVQNKLLFAVSGKTAPELIRDRCNAEQPNMGLQSWGGEVVRKRDVSIAKNYLGRDEINQLNRLTTMFLDMAEDRAEQRRQMTMADWTEFIDSFMMFSGREVLRNAGTVRRKTANEIADREWDKFSQYRDELANAEADVAAIEELRRVQREYEGKNRP